MLSYLVLVSVFACTVAGPPLVRSREEIESFEAFLENSRTDDGVRFEARMLRNPLASAWENSGKYQGDILLDDLQIKNLVKNFAEGRNAYIWPNTTWPDNTIPYEFAPDFVTLSAKVTPLVDSYDTPVMNWDDEQEAAIMDGMVDIEINTCITFRPRQSEDKNYVRVTGRPDGCYANVGYWSPRAVSTFNVAVNTPGRGCFRHTTIVHEWLHIIGFLHMQSTYNRDDYVRVLWENIWQGLEFNFEKYSSELVDNLGLPYEYDSNMHYGRYGFSKNGEPTLLPINDDNGLMGQQEYVTDFDWLRVNRHYNCPGAWDDLPEGSEENEVD